MAFVVGVHSLYLTKHSQVPTGCFVLEVLEWVSQDEVMGLGNGSNGNRLYVTHEVV